MWRISSLSPPPYNQKHFSLIVTMGTWSHSWRRISNIVVVHSVYRVQLFASPWTAAFQASPSFTISQSLLKFMSIESMMPSNYLILCHPFSCPQSFPVSGSFPMNQLFALGGQNIGASTSAPVLPMNIKGSFPLESTGLVSLLSKGFSRVFSTTVWKHQLFCTQLSFFMLFSSYLFLWSKSHIHVVTVNGY